MKRWAKICASLSPRGEPQRDCHRLARLILRPFSRCPPPSVDTCSSVLCACLCATLLFLELYRYRSNSRRSVYACLSALASCRHIALDPARNALPYACRHERPLCCCASYVPALSIHNGCILTLAFSVRAATEHAAASDQRV